MSTPYKQKTPPFGRGLVLQDISGYEMTVTFDAARPLGPFSTSNSTLSPSFKLLYPLAEIALKWTNTSSPPSREMKPKPFAALNHLTVPFSMERILSCICDCPAQPPGKVYAY